jgi:RNA recognition motif-containing protein
MEQADSRQIKLYVGNIDYSATEEELAQHFSKFGQVQFVNIPINRYTGRARGFGFVTFAREVEAERAMALNGSEFKGRQIQVNFAKEREREFA